MAEAPERVRIEDIDLVLRDAYIRNAQLNILHHMLNRVDEEKRKAIESRTATIFRDLMSNLYSVLDQIYFFLYCHFQNNGNLSFSNAASEIKQPIKQDLKWSDGTRDELSECKGRRNEWVRKQCNKIFGGNYPERNVQRIRQIRAFQNNLLHLQAIRKVDQSGEEVRGPDGEPTLLCARYIRHDAADLSQFNPSSISFEELKSVKDLDSWNDTTIFNLLHFFRNFTTHRSLIACLTRKGWLNLETREFKCEDQDLPEPWVFIANGAWILVPELSHLRQAGWVDPKCYQLPLLGVCAKALSFVKDQRDHFCSGVVDGVEHYPYEVTWNLYGMISFKKKQQKLGACYWDRANTWPIGTCRVLPSFLHNRKGSSPNR